MNSKYKKLELCWPGKDIEVKPEPRVLIEDPEKSYGEADTENMLIHADNLLALKALEQNFTGRIKCIYIDPPFNTGSAFEYYDDGIEHSMWLDLMNKRLNILYKLLAPEGVIFIHLDDNEAAYCKLLLDEIFGRTNYINQIINATNKPFGFKSTATNLFKQANHIFLYSKDRTKFELNSNKLFIEKGYDAQYKYVFLNPEEPEENRKWDTIQNVLSSRKGYKNAKEAKAKEKDFDFEIAMFAIENAENVFRTASVSGGAYLKRKDTIFESKGIKDKIIRHPNDDMDYMFIGGERVLFYKERLKEIDGELLPGDLLTDIWTDISVEGLASEGGIDFPKGKKPEKLIERCIDITTKKGDIILDSFLGSGTTAAVAHKMGRKWIGIELGDHANTHCLPRLKTVCDGSDQSGISKAVKWSGGGGFKFYNLAPSLLNKDKYSQWVINPNYNAVLLAAAMARHEGFTYSPDESVVWKQGFATENHFIFTTTNTITPDVVEQILSEMKPDESLRICCTAFIEGCNEISNRIEIKKIPEVLLGKCEFGKEDYCTDTNIINMPADPDKPAFTPSYVKPEVKPEPANIKKDTPMQTKLLF